VTESDASSVHEAHSDDLREKTLQPVDRGIPNSQAARTFGVNCSSVKRDAATRPEGRTLAPRKHPSSNLSSTRGPRILLEADVEDRPSIHP